MILEHTKTVLEIHWVSYLLSALQYLKDLKRRGARIIIGEFFERAARVTMCEAYKQRMTQKQAPLLKDPNCLH